MIFLIENWSSTIVSEADSIKKVIENLESTGLRIALVTNGEGKLVGTVTDGDIRRSML